MSVPLTSHPRASLDSPPPFVPFVPPTVAAAASVRWAAQAVWVVGAEGARALVFLNPGSGQPLKSIETGPRGFLWALLTLSGRAGGHHWHRGAPCWRAGAVTSPGEAWSWPGSVPLGAWEPQAA